MTIAWLLACLFLLGDEATLLEHLRAASDAGTIERLAREVVLPTGRTDRAAGEPVLELAAAWLRAGDPQKCAQVLAHYDDPVRNGVADLLRARATLARGYLRSAAGDLERAAAHAHASPRILELADQVTQAIQQAVHANLHDEPCGILLCELALVRRTLRDFDGALVLASELEKDWGAPFARSVRLIRGLVAMDQGRIDDAVGQLAPIANPGAGGLYRAFYALAALYEREHRWQDALDLYRSWRPDSDCGNGDAEIRIKWSAHMLRCRFHLGEVDVALRESFELATKRDLLADPMVVGGDLWAEMVARSGRTAEARERLTKPTPGRETFLGPRITIAELFAANDLGAMLDRVAHEPTLSDLAVRLVPSMRGAEATLAAAIARGDRTAIELAGRCWFRDLVPPLARRLTIESDPAVHTSIELALIALARPRD